MLFPHRRLLTVAAALLSFLSLMSVSVAEDRRPPFDFARDVFPILQRACLDCHGRDKQQAKLRLDAREAALKGGDSGAVIVPGKADDSELVRRIGLPKGDPEIMPARGEPLTKPQVAVIRAWIEQGAVWPDQVQPNKHWAYIKPVRPIPPAVMDAAWPRSPVDRFILAKLEQEGLRPSAAAERATLIRRLSLDLIGLPPSPAEVDRFVNDAKPQAYEELVDRLLASPQFGARWARPWLDLARYADSHGFQRDDLREVWAYRDWVIQALNDDMPFDRFTIEQIAGDVLPHATEAQRIATGFHRCVTVNVEAGSEPEETRINQVIDRVNTTAAVWLGTTLECAQCHDHKYDPFTQRDYYRFLAFFNSTTLEADRTNPKVPGSIKFLGPSMLLSDAPTQAERDRLAAEVAALKQEVAARRQQLGGELAAWETSLADGLKETPQTHPLDVAEFVSAGGAPHKVLDDKSVLLVDDAPDKDTYTVTVRTQLRGITGFKLEALADPSLPGNGPGRGDAQRPNFVLTTFAVTAAPAEEEDRPLPKSRAAAEPVKLTARDTSFTQKGFDLAGTLDANPKTGWAINPQFFQSHWATFTTDGPLGFDKGTTLTFKLVQEFGAGRTIGRLRLSALTGNPAGKSLPADLVAIVQTPRGKRTAAQQERLLDFRLEQDESSAAARSRLAQAEKSLKGLRLPSTLVMQELAEPRATAVFVRGDYRTPGELVQPAAPAVLPPLNMGAQTGPARPGSLGRGGSLDRLALARWLVDRENPLVARVMVNRWWGELFGQGLVGTPEDFGIKGEPPTHPELLDWLAVEFMDGGWSLKHLLRTIVLSSAYQQSSRVTPELLARDDRNRLYARGPRFRLDAERIRDNVLAAAGLVSLKSGGPPIHPYQPEGLWTKVGGEPLQYVASPGEDRHRRGIYVVWKRASPYPSFVNFDATSRLACTVQRSRSNTPLQALTLLNDPVYVEAAFALARRVLTERAGAPLDDQLRHAFRLCVARSPRESELSVIRRLFEQQLAANQAGRPAAHPLSSEYQPADCPPARFAAWCAVATTLLNLDETITRN